MVRIVRDYLHREEKTDSYWDNHEQLTDEQQRVLPYETTRIYDAIASFFSFIYPCVAIKSTDRKMSYNKDFTKLEIKPSSKQLSTFNIHATDQLIFDNLKECLRNEEKNILKLYLLLNTEFINFIDTRIKHEVTNEDIKQSSKNFRESRVKAFQFFQFQHIKLLIKDFTEDELEKTIKFILASHPEIKDLEKRIQELVENKKIATLETKDIFTAQIQAIKQDLRDKKKLLKQEIEEFENIENNLTFLDHHIFENLYDLYIDLISLIKSNKNTLSQELLGELLRPLQDVVKIKHIFTNNDIEELINKIIVISNPDGKHTEYNIFTEEGNDSTEDYIGVSKLCCGYCHNELGINEKNHRGTHGVLDERWKPDERRIDISNTLEVFEDSPTYQHRRLSFDDFEKNISLDFLNIDTNLADYKKEILGGATDIDH